MNRRLTLSIGGKAVLLTATALVFAALHPSRAEASDVRMSGTDLIFEATAGERNTVLVDEFLGFGVVGIRDSPNGPIPGIGCNPPDAFGFVFCTGVTGRIKIQTGDQDDVVGMRFSSFQRPFPYPLEVELGAGPDRWLGSPGADDVKGGDGDDRLRMSDGVDQLSGGPGFDIAEAPNPAFAGQTMVIGQGPILGDIEGLFGSGGPDRLVGDGNANFLDGIGGNDDITGGGGRDGLDGGDGDDILRSQDGEVDSIVCGPDNDTAFVDDFDDVNRPGFEDCENVVKPPAPIIFVHGFLGSKIVCGTTELWPQKSLRPLNIPDGLLDMRLAADGISNPPGSCGPQVGGIVDTVLGSDIYKSTVDFLNRIAPGRNHVFTWDWRKSPAASLADLDAFVDSVRALHGNVKVVLMAHSMGGLLTRWYVDDVARAGKVARALTIGTPYWGSPKALFPLAAGIETPQFSTLDPLLNDSDLQEFARNLHGAYFLYPSANYGPWLKLGFSSPPLDRAGPARVRGHRAWRQPRAAHAGVGRARERARRLQDQRGRLPSGGRHRPEHDLRGDDRPKSPRLPRHGPAQLCHRRRNGARGQRRPGDSGNDEPARGGRPDLLRMRDQTRSAPRRSARRRCDRRFPAHGRGHRRHVAE